MLMSIAISVVVVLVFGILSLLNTLCATAQLRRHELRPRAVEVTAVAAHRRRG